MATIITKNSSTGAAAPAVEDLVQGELAVNVTDKKIYTKDAGGAVVVLAEPATAAEVTLTNAVTLTNKDLTSGTNTFPTALATLTGIQTLTNKTLTAPALTDATGSLSTPTITAAILDGGYSEEVFALGTTGALALDPSNGSIQTCALTGNPTFSDSLAAGESIVLMLTNGASYTVTWPTVTWVKSGGSAAPTLTANDVLVFWKVSTTLYASYVGSGVA